MTKSEWNYKLREGSEVKYNTHDLVRVDGVLKSVPVIMTGRVERFNFGCSQVLVYFDNNRKSWHGRLSIELK
jgi:hypothetical protein